jgi:hypothetical protein
MGLSELEFQAKRLREALDPDHKPPYRSRVRTLADMTPEEREALSKQYGAPIAPQENVMSFEGIPDFMELSRLLLSNWERRFVKNCQERAARGVELSCKQISVLWRIKNERSAKTDHL